MYGILMTAVLAGTSTAPGSPLSAWDEINGVYGGYGSYGGFGGAGCGYSGYASYSRYTGCGPGPGYVYFIDNGRYNHPFPIFVPAPCPAPCFSPWCMPPAVDFMIGSEIKDDVKHDMKDKKKKKRRRKGEEDDDADDARVAPSSNTTLASFVNYDPRYNHRVVLTQAMWQRVR